jgi:SprT protein
MAANPNLLLSKDLRTKVEKKLLECLNVAREHYKRPDLEMPEIRYDVKNTDGGRANHAGNYVRFNLILCVENEKKFLDTTVPHELAHCIAGTLYWAKVLNDTGKKMRPHGKEWKEVMSVLQTPPTVCHSYDTTSIQKPKRRKRGSKLRGAEADLLVHRLTIAAKRMSKRHLERFIQNILAIHDELETSS